MTSDDQYTPDPNTASAGFTAEAADDPVGVAADAAAAKTTSNTTADGRAAEPAEHVTAVAATDAPEVGANESFIEFPDGSGGIKVTVGADGRPHFVVPLTKATKATKAKVGTAVAGVAIGAQFALSYIVPDDSPTATVLKVVLWAVGAAGVALGVYVPKNAPKNTSKH